MSTTRCLVATDGATFTACLAPADPARVVAEAAVPVPVMRMPTLVAVVHDRCTHVDARAGSDSSQRQVGVAGGSYRASRSARRT